MAAIGDPSDKVAGLDQFQPGLTKRGGKGEVTHQGVTYSRYEWVLRGARLGYTLNAGEGRLLADRIAELEGLVASAFREGQDGRILDAHEQFVYDVRWEDSEARKALGGA